MCDNNTLPAPSAEQQIMEPFRAVMESIARTLNMIAAGQEAQADRMRALEAAINSSIRVTPAQIKYLNTAIRERANGLLARLTVEDAKARRKLSNMIRRDTLVFFGISSISEIPASEYSHARNLIMSWKNVVAVRDIAKEVQCDADAE